MPSLLYSALSYGEDPFSIHDNVLSIQSHKQMDTFGTLLLHGGADISPSIYQQMPNKYCNADTIPSQRDAIEMEMIQQARKMNLPIVGICRGAQLLCAIDGGTLCQHIENHTGSRHTIQDKRTKELYVSNSCHHQMMQPSKYAQIIASCNTIVEGIDENNQVISINDVPEIVYFPRLRALGIQGHPEWMPDTNFTRYCAKLIQELLLKE